MRTRAIAAIELVLILPAALSMTALVLRNLPQFEHGAQQLVMWYARRMWSLWVLLLGLPLTVLVSGCATLARDWERNMQSLAMILTHSATLLIAATTAGAGVILPIVALHMLAN